MSLLSGTYTVILLVVNCHVIQAEEPGDFLKVIFNRRTQGRGYIFDREVARLQNKRFLPFLGQSYDDNNYGSNDFWDDWPDKSYNNYGKDSDEDDYNIYNYYDYYDDYDGYYDENSDEYYDEKRDTKMNVIQDGNIRQLEEEEEGKSLEDDDTEPSESGDGTEYDDDDDDNIDNKGEYNDESDETNGKQTKGKDKEKENNLGKENKEGDTKADGVSNKRMSGKHIWLRMIDRHRTSLNV